MKTGLLLLATIWMSAVPAGAQDVQVKINLLNCQNAKGSQRASDVLQTLKKLSEGTGREDAIAACDEKVQSLKKTEDDKWNRAVQGRSSGQCALAKGLFEELAQSAYGTAYQKQAGDQLHTLNCSSPAGGDSSNSNANACADAQVSLRNAQGAFRAVNLPQAKTYATAAQACPLTADDAKKILDEIDRTEKSRRFAESARLALNKKDTESACRSILQIDPNYPELKDLKRQAGECAAPPPPVPAPVADNGRGQRATAPPTVSADPLLADYNRAAGLVKSKPAEAERMLQKLYAADKGYKDVAQLLKDVHDDLQNQNFAELEKQARNNLDKGDLQAALGKIDRAVALRPNEGRLQDFKQLVVDRLAKEGSELSSGISAYYAGKYPDARKLLTAFLEKPHSSRLLAFASFYAGAASASEYYLGGQADAAKKEEARKAFLVSIEDAPQFSPDWAKVSPKIRSLFLEATGKAGQK